MPTPHNAINNSINLLGWPHTVAAEKRKNAAKYSRWRSAIETKITANKWLWKNDTGNGYDAFVIEYVKLKDFPSSGALVIQQKLADDTRPAHEAVNELLIDCFKKERESQNKRKRNVAQEDIEAEAMGGRGETSDIEGPARVKRPRFEDGEAIFIYIIDPIEPTHGVVDATTNTKTWQWNLPGSKKMVVIFEPSLNDLHIKSPLMSQRGGR